MNRRIYIAGKVTGLPWEEVVRKFADFERYLAGPCVEVVNPITHVMTMSRVKVIDSWAAELKECIPAMLHCDELHLMPCWKQSRGARLERYIAIRLGMKIVYYKEPTLSDVFKQLGEILGPYLENEQI